MKRRAKVLSIFLCLALVVTMMPMAAVTAYGEDGIIIDSNNFPDDVFRTVVEEFDLNGDGQLRQSEINSVTSIRINNSGVASLEGIQYFTELSSLSCYSNYIEELDVSKNVKLVDLDCSNNIIKELDLSKNTELKHLYCRSNKLETLDLSKNTKLEELDFGENDIASIDLSKSTQIITLNGAENKELKSIDLSKLTKLDDLNLSYSGIESLDLSKNLKLRMLYCYSTPLAQLDISKNAMLEHIEFDGTNITTLDVSHSATLSNIVKYGEVSTGNDEYDLYHYTVNDTSYEVYAPKTIEFITISKPTSAKATLTNYYSKVSGYRDVKVSWAKVPSADGYQVSYKKISDPDTEYTLYEETNGLFTLMKGLDDGTGYIFKITPYYYDYIGNIVYSDTSATAKVYTLKKLATPKLTKSGTKVKVKWNNIAGETGYQISQSTKKGATKIVATVATTKGTSKLVKATKGKTYYYKVRAYKTVDGVKIYGPWSPVKAFKR